MGAQMPAGCKVLSTKGVHYHDGVIQLPATTESVEHGTHGFTYSEMTASQSSLQAGISWWHLSGYSVEVGLVYQIAEPSGVNCSVPGGTYDEP